MNHTEFSNSEATSKCALADRSARLVANMVILQNNLEVNCASNAFFTPHSPQPGLITRLLRILGAVVDPGVA